MHDKPRPPVILLVYANDRADPKRHLRSLADECDAIHQALRDAEQAGLCELEVLANAKPDRLYRAFQSKELRNRIAVLHFAGHADGHQLLFETSGDMPGAANAAGLARFLALQPALRLVFLNGCSTREQADGLISAGCRAVIVTHQAIDDGAAMRFAERFYRGLGSPDSDLERAYSEAAAASRAESPDGTPRGLYWKGAEETTTARWPWELIPSPDATNIARWNLPAAAGDWLFGLPPLPERDLPECPYLERLQWFHSEHAEVFFGRGKEIRQLYDAVTAHDGAPIILFYGQSGVGKSSILDAGLLPRIAASHRTDYLRRDKDLGLLGTLLGAFGAEHTDLATAWRAAEQPEGAKPRLIVLDQVEEVFTRRNDTRPQEFEDLADALAALFGERDARPAGRLILGFRKEWQPEISARLKARGLPTDELFVESLSEGGIIEAISGPESGERLRRAYRLEIEPGLARMIANDLLADRESPIAPTLQLLLVKLWDQVRAHSMRHFSKDGYRSLKRKGILLRDFLGEQIDKVREERREQVDSGLALDVLAYHIDPNGSAAAERAEKEIAKTYCGHGERVPDLIASLKHHSLLADLFAPEDSTPKKGSRLAHDTLALLVRLRSETSPLPGQKAKRILDNRSAESRNRKVGTLLSEEDLREVEAGKVGMRDWTDDEERLVAASRMRVARLRRGKRILQGFGMLALVSIVVAGLFAIQQWLVAERQARVADSRLIANQAQSLKEADPNLALLLAAEAVREPWNITRARTPMAESTLRDLLSGPSGPRLLGEYGIGLDGSLLFDPQARWLVRVAPPGYVDPILQWSLKQPWKDPVPIQADSARAKAVAIDPKGRWLAIGERNGSVRLHPLEVNGDQPRNLTKHDNSVHALVFSPQGRWLATAASDLRLWDLDHWMQKPLDLGGKNLMYASIAFGPKGRWLAAAGDARQVNWNILSYGFENAEAKAETADITSILLWDLEQQSGEPLKLSGHSSQPTSLAFDPKGRWLISHSGSELSLWDLRKLGAKPFDHFTKDLDRASETNAISAHDPFRLTVGRQLFKTGTLHACAESDWSCHVECTGDIKLTAVDPEGKWLASVSSNSPFVSLWDLDQPDNMPLRIEAKDDNVNALAFAPNGRWLTTGHESGISRMWDLKSRRFGMAEHAAPLRLQGAQSDNTTAFDGITALAFSRDGALLATVGKVIRLWRLDSVEPILLPSGKVTPIESVIVGPDGSQLTLIGADSHFVDLTTQSTKHLSLENRYFKNGAIDQHANLPALAVDVVRRRLYAARGDSVVSWDLRRPKAQRFAVGEDLRASKQQLAISPNGNWLALTGGGPGVTLHLWDLTNPESQPDVLPLPSGTDGVAFDPRSRWLVTTPTIRFLDPTEPRAASPIDHGFVERYAFSRSGRWFAGMEPGQDSVKIWNLNNPSEKPAVRKLLYSSPGVSPLNSILAFSPQERWLGAISRGSVALLNLDTSAEPVDLPGQTGDANSLTFHEGERWLAVSGRAGPKLWDLSKPGESPQEFRRGQDCPPVVSRGLGGRLLPPSGPVFDSSGRKLAAVCGAYSVAVWDLDQPGAEPFVLYVPAFGDRSALRSVFFDSDDRRLIGVRDNGSVVLWHLDVDVLLDKACLAASRNLTEAEWAEYVGDSSYRRTCAQFPADVDVPHLAWRERFLAWLSTLWQ